MTVDNLKKIAKANGVSICSPKHNLVSKIVQRFDTLNGNFDQVLSLENSLKFLSNKSNTCFHDFNLSHFNFIDRVSKYWYQYEEPHRYIHWQN